MFAKSGVYEACGIFTTGHFILIGITVIAIILALKVTSKKSKEQVHKIITCLTIPICILEIIKIIFNITVNSAKNINTYVPLYYCSMLIYAGLLSSFGKRAFKRIGDVFLATGGIVGGIVFVLFPTTSLPSYPMFHFISLHSFFFHGTMIYLGILVNITNYIKLERNDIKYFVALVGTVCVIALIINNIFDSNLMFISKNFPNSPLEIIYNLTNGTILYNLIMISVQLTLPFYVPYWIIKKVKKVHSEEGKEIEEKTIGLC